MAVQSSQTPHSYESVNRKEVARGPLGVEAQAVGPGSAGDWLFVFFAGEPAARCHHWFKKRQRQAGGPNFIVTKDVDFCSVSWKEWNHAL